ncbi:MAG: phytoene desaturase family protein, partial [Sphingobacterium sp.]
YLDVLEDIHFEQLDQNQFDIIRFKGDPVAYPQAQGYDNFVTQLVKRFPEERESLQRYIEEVKFYCSKFPLYEGRQGFGYDEQMMRPSCHEIISRLTSNRKLQAVLLGNGFLYGLHEDAPFYMHALIINSYIKSAWRCIRGGSQISRAFTRQLRLNRARLFTHQKVIKLNFEQDGIKNCETVDHIYEADHFVSNLNPHSLFALFDEKNRDKPYIRRLEKLNQGPSAFSTHIVLKPDTVPYFNHNIYHFDAVEDAFSYQRNWDGFRPKSLLITCGPHQKNQQFTSNISMLTYMEPLQVEQWKRSLNTVSHPQERGENYTSFKEQIAEEMIGILAFYIPQVKNNIMSTHTSSPLTYRDYLGSESGAMYGIEKQASDPLVSLISPRTKVKNLVLTGQDVRLHGLLGVTITGFLAAGEILGRDSFFDTVFKQLRDASGD